MEYREFLPDKALRPFIECYWSAVAGRPPFREQEALIPDGTIELMFNFGDSYRHMTGEKGGREVNRAHLIGIRRSALWIAQSSRQDFFCVRFRPGGSFPFFRIPARKFADTILPIDELLPKKYRVLEQQLYALETSAARVQLLNRFFLDQVPEVPVQWETTCRFIAASASGRFTIAATLRELPYHYRTLERHFKTATGLSPEEYLKIRRFNNAVQIMYSGRFSRMTEIAYQAGYYDQSHFIRDFKKFSGQTPLQFIRSQFKIVEVIQPALAERLSKSYNFGI